MKKLILALILLAALSSCWKSCPLYTGDSMGATIDLKVDGVAYQCVPNNVPTPTPPPNPTPPPTPSPPPPSGELGSLSNPIPVNVYAGGRGIYYPSTGQGGSAINVGYGTTYFLVDPSIVSGANKFSVVFKGYNNTTLLYSRIVQDKAGNTVEGAVNIQNYTGDGYDTVFSSVYLFSTRRFVYGIENPNGTYPMDFWVQFM